MKLLILKVQIGYFCPSPDKYSKSGLAAHYRRLRARIGAPKAINATARKIAIIFYNMLKNKTTYISQSQEEYDKAHKQRILKQLQQKAVQFGLELVPVE